MLYSVRLWTHRDKRWPRVLLDAQVKAQALFEEIDARNLIRPEAKESEINEGIYALAERMYLFSRRES